MPWSNNGSKVFMAMMAMGWNKGSIDLPHFKRLLVQVSNLSDPSKMKLKTCPNVPAVGREDGRITIGADVQRTRRAQGWQDRQGQGTQLWPIQLWPYIAMALYSYGPI